MLPQKQYVDPHILYLRDIKEGTFTSKDYHLFKNLNERLRYEYQLKYLQLYNLDVNNLIAFLTARGLTYESFMNIKTMCQRYYNFKKLNRKSKNKIKLSVSTDK